MDIHGHGECNETGNDPIVDFTGQQRLVDRKINKQIIAHLVNLL